VGTAAQAELGVGQARLQRERPDLRQQQWAEGVGRGTAEELDDPCVGQRAEQRRGAVPPVRLERGEGAGREPVLVGGQVGQPGRGPVGAEQPTTEPLVNTA
jgi:hypothetical protein